MVKTYKMRHQSKKQAGIWVQLSATLLSIGAIASSLFVVAGNTAQGSNSSDPDTLGFGDLQNKRSEEQAQARPSEFIFEDQAANGTLDNTADVSLGEGDLASEVVQGKNNTEGASTETLAALKSSHAKRVINVPDPDPVIEITAFDANNPQTAQLASQLGVYKPPAKVPRVLPNVGEPGWQKGLASAYDLETNQGWSATSSGVSLTRDSVTVAVPASQRHLVGRAVEIVYGNKVVVATITDTGGFERYGRALDLAGGVWKAFDAQSWAEWGVRPVYYRVL